LWARQNIAPRFTPQPDNLPAPSISQSQTWLTYRQRYRSDEAIGVPVKEKAGKTFARSFIL
jgi:hypothetical protein